MYCFCAWSNLPCDLNITLPVLCCCCCHRCNNAAASADSRALSPRLADKISVYLADTEHLSGDRASSSSSSSSNSSSNKFNASATCFGKPLQSTQALLAELDTFLATGWETIAGFITASCV
jgi:hypothetical protein